MYKYQLPLPARLQYLKEIFGNRKIFVQGISFHLLNFHHFKNRVYIDLGSVHIANFCHFLNRVCINKGSVRIAQFLSVYE
jgi:hypothetical protein